MTQNRSALDKMHSVFPFGVRLKNGPWLFCSWFCTEKPHPMVHWADNCATVGRTRIMSTSVTETRMKPADKIPARKANNQASFCESILKNNMETDAAMELVQHLDETGLHIVFTNNTKICFSLLQVYLSKSVFE